MSIHFDVSLARKDRIEGLKNTDLRSKKANIKLLFKTLRNKEFCLKVD